MADEREKLIEKIQTADTLHPLSSITAGIIADYVLANYEPKVPGDGELGKILEQFRIDLYNELATDKFYAEKAGKLLDEYEPLIRAAAVPAVPGDGQPKDQVAAMEALGFQAVDEVGGGWSYAKQIDENPPHLTNGTSWLQLTQSQAADYLRIIASQAAAAQERAIKDFKNRAIKIARHYTADGLVADALDPWAVSVKELEALAAHPKQPNDGGGGE